MFIKSIQIENYRSFQEPEKIFFVEGLNKPYTIIGENNSGKSNLINSILIGTGYKYMGEDSLGENDFFNKDISKKIKISIELDQNQGLSFDSSENYNAQPNITDNSTGSYIKYDKKKEISSKIFYIDFQEISRLLKVKTDWSYTLLGKKIKEFRNKLNTDKEKLKETHGKIKKLIKDDIFDLDPNFKAFVSDIEKFLKEHLRITNDDFLIDFTILEVDKIINALGFYISEDGEKPQLPVENLGNGYKALIVSAILRAIAKDDEGGKVFIFEEPETFLHENFEDYFYNNILKELAKKNQVIITTHSKNFIDIFDYRTIIKITNKGGESKVKQEQKLDLAERCKNKFEAISALQYPQQFGLFLKSIDPNLNQLGFSKKVIIVEGPHDVLAYKLALDTKFIVMKEVGDDGNEIEKEIKDEVVDGGLAFNGISIIPAHSKDIISNLAVICYNLDIPFFIIFDYDLPEDTQVNFSYDILGSTYKDEHHSCEVYSKLGKAQKQQYTKNLILGNIATKLNGHYNINKPKLEGVLGYEIDDLEKLTYKNKSTTSVFSKLQGKTLEQIKTEFPNFITQDLVDFIKN